MTPVKTILGSLLVNAVLSALLGLGVLILVGITNGSISTYEVLRFGGIGATIGTISGLLSEVLFVLFGPRPWLAYFANSLIIAIFVPLFAWIVFGVTFIDEPWIILISTIASEMASLFLVHRGVLEFQRFQKALLKRQEELIQLDE